MNTSFDFKQFSENLNIVQRQNRVNVECILAREINKVETNFFYSCAKIRRDILRWKLQFMSWEGTLSISGRCFVLLIYK